MPYRKTEFANGEIYHIILRAIDEMLLFKDINDYYRGIFSVYEFNNTKPTTIQERRRARKSFKNIIPGRKDGRRTSILSEFVDSREKLVNVLAFCFMPNHIHLLLKQHQDNGIHKFMVKLGSGYGRYFNQKSQRKGYVFQNRFYSVHIKDDNQLRTVVNYIHANPVSLIEPNFKEFGIKNHSAGDVLLFLKTGHRWSSLPDYIGGKNFPSVTERDFILEFMGGVKNMEDILMDWILYKKEMAAYESLFILK